MKAQNHGARRLFILLSMLLALSACKVPMRYNSLDLALLPCEEGDSPVFFKAIEFDKNGVPLFPEQVERFKDRLSERPVTDLVFFVHGWNKNLSSAELDYQNFLCRLHARLRGILGEDSKRKGGLLVAGIFWPSTITNRAKEPVLVKPLSYYQVRDRADTIAASGLADLFSSLTPLIRPGDPSLRLHLIGHSFGGRMIVRSLKTLQDRDELIPLLVTAGSANVILINAALPPTRFDWIEEAVTKAKTLARFTDDTGSYLFNIHSFRDSANRRLFPIASLFNDDPATCAAGACGVPDYATLCVDNSGEIQLTIDLSSGANAEQVELNAWNVDASKVVFEHSDIYKGRIATLIATLLYDQELKQQFPRNFDPNNSPKSRCD